MRRLETDVLVVGGGATGLGVVRDAALRGLDAVLVERGDLGTGTSGRFHGLVHSGARYVVKDPGAAAECARENAVLRRIASATIEDTGGLFLAAPDDDPAYADGFADACRVAGVPVEEIEPAAALAREPRLDPRVSRAFLVEDASVDVWQLLWATAASAREHGARVLPYHPVVALLRDGDAVVGARVRDERAGEELEIRSRVVVNAAGAWAGRIAALAGIDDVRVVPGRGIMVAVNHRLVDTVVNRCTPPGDGDLLVPVHTVSIIGTTDVEAADADDLAIDEAEVQQMLDAGERLVPGFRASRILRVWAGVRPLFVDGKAEAATTRDLSRGHRVLDHRARDGVPGLLTITGGKLTTFRLMAEDAVDAVCRELGEERACRTADEPLPGSTPGVYADLAARVRRHERSLRDEQLVCECELVSRGQLEQELRERPTADLDDLRRTLRLGMGPCQGGFCVYRATGVMHDIEQLGTAAANRALREFLRERWRGVHPVLHGDQLRQARVDDWIFKGLLGVDRVPDA